MSDQPKPAGSIGRTLPLVVAAVLIASFLYRVLVTAHEYPMRAEQVMTMLIDLGLLAGLIVMRSRMSKTLFWVGLVAGIGVFAIRLNGDASWWTGHLSYSLPPR